MRKVLGTFLEFAGFTKTEIETVLGLLSGHLAVELAITVVVLLLTVAVPILIARPLADMFDRRARARDRAERVVDTTLAAYQEIFTTWKAMIEAFGSDTQTLKVLVGRMSKDPFFFPLFTFDDSDPAIYENYVTKDIAIFPSNLIGSTIDFYQSSQFFLAYLKDSRSEQVQKLPLERKIGFLKNVYSTGYEYIVTGCEALTLYEPWVDECRVGTLASMSWLAEIGDLKSAIDADGVDQLVGL
jgi:hypothetical protein